jgi:membrane fusion protein (multidrug efflux system)
MNEMSRVAPEIIVGEPKLAPKRNYLRLAAMLSVPLLLALAGAYLWVSGIGKVSTDNAQVNAHMVAVAPEVGGKVTDVYVVENQQVKKGDLLFRIDPEPYRIALLQADASVGNAELSIAQAQSNYHSKAADTLKSSSDVTLAQDTFHRQQELLARGFTTRAAFDAARAQLAAARADVASTQAEAESARAVTQLRNGGHPQVEAAVAMRDKAKLDLARTEIRAPMDGTISQADKLNPGTLAMQSLTMLNVVSAQGYWIEANFKETQLADIRIGQSAEVEIDAIPGKTFRGHVIGIGSGTGSQFSILPAQNATGNWVKVTQRVPVRIQLDEAPSRPLVAGWSSHVTVHTAR